MTQCNGGIYVGGGGEQAGYASGCTVYGSNKFDERDYGIWDDGAGGATWVGCRVEYVGGTPFRVTQLNSVSVFVGCYDESGVKDTRTGAEHTSKPRIYRGMVIGGQLAHAGNADAFTADTRATVFSDSGHFNLYAIDQKAKGGSALYSFLGAGVQASQQNMIVGALPGSEPATSGIVWTKDTVHCPDGW